MTEPAEPTDDQLADRLESLLSTGGKIPLDRVVAKVERDFGVKADDALRRRIRDLYVTVRDDAARRRRKSAAYKLLFIAAFCILTVVVTSLTVGHQVPLWMKIALLAVGVPAWFLGLGTLFAKPRRPA